MLLSCNSDFQMHWARTKFIMPKSKKILSHKREFVEILHGKNFANLNFTICILIYLNYLKERAVGILSTSFPVL